MRSILPTTTRTFSLCLQRRTKSKSTGTAFDRFYTWQTIGRYSQVFVLAGDSIIAHTLLAAKKMKGFVTSEAIILGVESRTSSPVRIPRHKDTLQHIQIQGLYPCGEGAGYSGGITSSAIDGQRVAEHISLIDNEKNR